jgi:hypothetical protein
MSDIVRLSFHRKPSSLRYMLRGVTPTRRTVDLQPQIVYARRLGFPRALFHPPRALGECLSRLAGPRGRGGLQRLDAWLKGPVPHGTPVRLHAAPGTDQTPFALFVERARPCMVGRLQQAA